MFLCFTHFMKTKINKKAASYEINNYTKEKLEIRQMLAELNTRQSTGHDISRGLKFDCRFQTK